MPAVQLSRLRQQSSELASIYHEPVLFSRKLRMLLEQYADHTQRYGRTENTPGLLLTYHVPQIVIRQFVLDLKENLKIHPGEMLSLIQYLWGENTWEHRKLAINLLGHVDQPPPTIINCISQWLASHPEDQIIEEIMRYGTKRLRLEHLSHYLELSKNWLESPEVYFQKCGLYAVMMLVEDVTFENLPVLYRMIAPRIRKIPIELRVPVTQLLTLLARRFPRETAYFLTSTLDAPQNPDTPWLVRKIMREFPSDIQGDLKEGIRK